MPVAIAALLSQGRRYQTSSAWLSAGVVARVIATNPRWDRSTVAIGSAPLVCPAGNTWNCVAALPPEAVSDIGGKTESTIRGEPGARVAPARRGPVSPAELPPMPDMKAR